MSKKNVMGKDRGVRQGWVEEAFSEDRPREKENTTIMIPRKKTLSWLIWINRWMHFRVGTSSTTSKIRSRRTWRRLQVFCKTHLITNSVYLFGLTNLDIQARTFDLFHKAWSPPIRVPYPRRVHSVPSHLTRLLVWLTECAEVRLIIPSVVEPPQIRPRADRNPKEV